MIHGSVWQSHGWLIREEKLRSPNIFRKLEAASRQEPGCLMYVVHQHRTDPRLFFIYEQYSNDAALEAHRQSRTFSST